MTWYSDTWENRWLVDYAVDKYLELPVQYMPSYYGAIKIDFVDPHPDEDICGVSLDDDGCSRLIRSARHEVVVAHEIGHALGLEHVDDQTNLMYQGARENVSLTEDQLDTVAWNAGLVDACVPF